MHAWRMIDTAIASGGAKGKGKGKGKGKERERKGKEKKARMVSHYFD